MEDINGMKSLLLTSNIAIIKKLYSYAPYETSELIKTTLNEMMNIQFNKLDMINWLLDNIKLDEKILNWLFESIIIVSEYMSLPEKHYPIDIMTKLIDYGAHIATDVTKNNYECIHRGLLFLHRDNFFEYISKHNFEISVQNIKYIFTVGVEKQVQNFLYDEWKKKSSEWSMDDIAIILTWIFREKYCKYDAIIKELIKIADQKNFLKIITVSLIDCASVGLIEYIEPYESYDDFYFLQQVKYTMRYQRRFGNDKWYDEQLENLSIAINKNDEATQLYYAIVDRNSLLPSEINYDEEMKDVLALKKIIQYN